MSSIAAVECALGVDDVGSRVGRMLFDDSELIMSFGGLETNNLSRLQWTEGLGRFIIGRLLLLASLAEMCCDACAEHRFKEGCRGRDGCAKAP